MDNTRSLDREQRRAAFDNTVDAALKLIGENDEADTFFRALLAFALANIGERYSREERSEIQKHILAAITAGVAFLDGEAEGIFQRIATDDGPVWTFTEAYRRQLGLEKGRWGH